MAYSPRPAETTEEGHPVLSATPARQGLRGRHVLWVLLISTLLAAIALAVAWGLRASDLAATNTNNGDRQTAAPAFNSAAPPSPARQ